MVRLADTEPAVLGKALHPHEFTYIAAVMETTLSPSTRALSTTPTLNVLEFSPAPSVTPAGNIKAPGTLADKVAEKADGLLLALRRRVAVVAKKPAVSGTELVCNTKSRPGRSSSSTSKDAEAGL